MSHYNTTKSRQGCLLDPGQVGTIIRLLAETDMTFGDIAERMQCSKAAVSAINRKHAVRDYAGKRSTWTVTAGLK